MRSAVLAAGKTGNDNGSVTPLLGQGTYVSENLREEGQQADLLESEGQPR